MGESAMENSLSVIADMGVPAGNSIAKQGNTQFGANAVNNILADGSQL
jgi:hypothetical protein